MATMFKKGELVKLKAVIPQGDVQALRMLEDGTVQCLLSWVDADGVEQNRWFNEDDLVAV
jgi:uncharacterized protein YodC (DUF2158 family)